MAATSHYKKIRPYTTRDGSEIRELVHPELHHNKNQSLAEARIEPGEQTRLHYHEKSEEIYFITHGEGKMTLKDEQFHVGEGDTVYIPPGTAHCIKNTGQLPLRILCMCAPAYAHEDTHLL